MDIRNRSYKTNIYTKEQIKRVLAGSGINVESEVDSDYIIFCPFHNNNRTPAGEVDKIKGTFFCFSCQKITDLVELVMHTSGRAYFEAVRFIKSKEQETNIEQEINKALYKKPDFVEFDSKLIDSLNSQALSSSRCTNYFAGRKISIDSIKRFSLGYSVKQDMVTVPVHSPDGLCVGFVGRSVEGKEFKNTPGLPKSKLLFNLHRVKISDSIYVVESSFDVIRLAQVNIPAVATLGANISNSQTDLLEKYFSKIYIIADNDEAGSRMKDRIISKFGNRAGVVQLDSMYKDIGDMTDEEIMKIDASFDKEIWGMLK